MRVSSFMSALVLGAFLGAGAVLPVSQAQAQSRSSVTVDGRSITVVGGGSQSIRSGTGRIEVVLNGTQILVFPDRIEIGGDSVATPGGGAVELDTTGGALVVRVGGETVFGADTAAAPDGTAADSAAAEIAALEARVADGDRLAMNLLGVRYYNGDGVPRDFERAAELYRQAAELGEPASQTNLGGMYLDGQGTDPDPEQAVRWARAAVAQGYPGGWVLLARLHRAGFGVPQDDAEAVDLLRLGAEAGDMLGQRLLGVAYMDGDGVEADPEQALRWLEAAEAQGDLWSTVNIGVMHLRGDLGAADPARALALFLAAAEAGNRRAQLNIWYMRRDHPELDIPRDEAFRWLQEAADQGEPGALYELAMVRRGSDFGPPDPAAAEALLERAAAADHPGAIDELGLLFVNEGRSYDRALTLARRGAELGSSPSMNTVGVIHAQGLGVPVDEAEAVRWFLRAAEAGSLDARRNMGIVFENGMGGMPVDLHAAVSWFEFALEGGLSRASNDVGRASGRILSIPGEVEAERYWYGEGGQAQGPVSFAALLQQRAAGAIGPQTFVWRDGLPEWMRYADLFGGAR